MLQRKICINVFSDMNTWIDFCIVFELYTDFTKAEEIVKKAYDDWWEPLDAQFEPISDYISRCLTENDIKHEIYFKNDEDEVD